MQRKRLWAIALVTGVAALITALVTDRPERSGETAALEGAVSVPDIGDRLAQAGLGCGAVIRNEPPEPEDREELAPVESALCSVGGTEELADGPVHALILVYDSDVGPRDPDSGPPGHALVYGDRWEVYVPARAAAEAIVEALGGELRLPDDFADPGASPLSE